MYVRSLPPGKHPATMTRRFKLKSNLRLLFPMGSIAISVMTATANRSLTCQLLRCHICDYLHFFTVPWSRSATPPQSALYSSRCWPAPTADFPAWARGWLRKFKSDPLIASISPTPTWAEVKIGRNYLRWVVGAQAKWITLDLQLWSAWSCLRC